MNHANPKILPQNPFWRVAFMFFPWSTSEPKRFVFSKVPKLFYELRTLGIFLSFGTFVCDFVFAYFWRLEVHQETDFGLGLILVSS